MFPEPFREFVRLFNERRFWESHEALEDRWRETGSDFYQGLIIYASAFVHAQRGNAHGVIAQLRKAERYLAPYRPAYHGVDLEALLDLGRRWREVVAGDRRDDGADRSREASERANAALAWSAALPWPHLRPSPDLVRGDEPELDPWTTD